jgi:hypothetical protein
VTEATLKVVKLAHTVNWAFFVICILAIPLTAWRGSHHAAGWLVATFAIEVAVLLGNLIVSKEDWAPQRL